MQVLRDAFVSALQSSGRASPFTAMQSVVGLNQVIASVLSWSFH